MYRPFASAILLIALATTALAQGGSKGVVAVDAAGPSAAIPAGSTLAMTVTLRIKGGYHVNAQKPSEDYLVGTSLKLTLPAGLTVAKIAYPGAKMAQLGFSETPLAVYEGTVAIVATLKVDKAGAPGTVTIPGEVTFQACNDQSCLPPSTVKVSATAEIAPAEAAKGTLTLTGAPPDARVLVDGKAVGATDARGRFVSKAVETGRRRVRVEHDGFDAWEQQIVVDGTKPLTVPVSLVASAADPAPAVTPLPAETAPSTAPVPPAPTSAPPGALDPRAEDEPQQPTALLLGGFGIVAAAVIAAAVLFKKK